MREKNKSTIARESPAEEGQAREEETREAENDEKVELPSLFPVGAERDIEADE